MMKRVNMKTGTKQWKRIRRQYWQNKYKLACGCERCGYRNNPRVLTFDHIDPSTKHPIVKNGSGLVSMKAGGMFHLTHSDIPLKVMVDEWRKCRILCFNCHMEDKYHVHNLS
jgi:hypothetical protein